MTVWLVGVDIGASGSRLVAARRAATDDRLVLSGARVSVTAAGSTVAAVLRDLVRSAVAEIPELRSEGVAAAAVGAAGLATMVPDPREVATVFETKFGAAPVAVAVDSLTAHLGALGGRAGAVLSAGTGAIAFGTDLADQWHRVDGWGHLLGDLGSGAWIGMEGLRAAAAAHDGRQQERSLALLALARERFGAVETWPAQLYPRDDRAGVLATFAPDVGIAAAASDTQAVRILTEAATHLASTLAGAMHPELPALAAYSGGLFNVSREHLFEPFRLRFAEFSPATTLVEPVGTSLDGALRLAELAASGSLVSRPPFLFLHQR